MADTYYSTGLLETNLAQLNKIIKSDAKAVALYERLPKSDDNDKSIKSSKARYNDTKRRIEDIEYSISILEGKVCLT